MSSYISLGLVSTLESLEWFTLQSFVSVNLSKNMFCPVRRYAHGAIKSPHLSEFERISSSEERTDHWIKILRKKLDQYLEENYLIAQLN